MPTVEELRVNRGLSIAQLAKETGVPEHVIRYTERTGARPRPDSALRIASYFSLRVTDIWPSRGNGNNNGHDDNQAVA